eukprot:5324801-Prymnesium_polylepis.1
MRADPAGVMIRVLGGAGPANTTRWRTLPRCRRCRWLRGAVSETMTMPAAPPRLETTSGPAKLFDLESQAR